MYFVTFNCELQIFPRTLGIIEVCFRADLLQKKKKNLFAFVSNLETLSGKNHFKINSSLALYRQMCTYKFSGGILHLHSAPPLREGSFHSASFCMARVLSCSPLYEVFIFWSPNFMLVSSTGNAARAGPQC